MGEMLDFGFPCIDKKQLLDHLGLCVSIAKDDNVRQVLQNLKQDLEAGQFDSRINKE